MVAEALLSTHAAALWCAFKNLEKNSATDQSRRRAVGC
jgi:hypothetical protein